VVFGTSGSPRAMLTLAQENSGSRRSKTKPHRAYEGFREPDTCALGVQVSRPKYRRKVIYAKLRTSIERILRDLCDQKGIGLLEGHCGERPCSSVPEHSTEVQRGVHDWVSERVRKPCGYTGRGVAVYPSRAHNRAISTHMGGIYRTMRRPGINPQQHAPRTLPLRCVRLTVSPGSGSLIGSLA